MPVLIVLVLALLIAQVGFWKALAAVLGGILMLLLLLLLALALVVLIVLTALRRRRRLAYLPPDRLPPDPRA